MRLSTKNALSYCQVSFGIRNWSRSFNHVASIHLRTAKYTQHIKSEDFSIQRPRGFGSCSRLFNMHMILLFWKSLLFVLARNPIGSLFGSRGMARATHSVIKGQPTFALTIFFPISSPFLSYTSAMISKKSTFFDVSHTKNPMGNSPLTLSKVLAGTTKRDFSSALNDCRNFSNAMP